jgi:EpsI family protein
VGERKVPAAIGETLHDVIATQMTGRDARSVEAWQWYWIDGVVTSNEAVAKAAIAWSRLRGRGDDAAAIVVFSDAPSPQRALDGFVHDAWPTVAAALESAREHR